MYLCGFVLVKGELFCATEAPTCYSNDNDLGCRHMSSSDLWNRTFFGLLSSSAG